LRSGVASRVFESGDTAKAAEGLKVELGRVLVVSAARLHVSLMPESPETSEDLEGFFVGFYSSRAGQLSTRRIRLETKTTANPAVALLMRHYIDK